MDEILKKCIAWPDDTIDEKCDDDLVGDCLHGIMDDCMDVVNFDLNSEEQKNYLCRKHCLPCLVLYNATVLDTMDENLKLINKKLKKLERMIKNI